MGLANEFRKALLQHKRIFLDSSILIYHLEDIQPYSIFTTELFMALSKGTIECIISTLSITELLTKPFKENKNEQIEIFEAFIFSLPQTQIAFPSYNIAKQAAKLRGQYNLRTPDSILLSTALEETCDVFLTNDYHLKRIETEGIVVIVLSEFART
jgi:predicted nucleic acid-binding protein